MVLRKGRRTVAVKHNGGWQLPRAEYHQGALSLHHAGVRALEGLGLEEGHWREAVLSGPQVRACERITYYIYELIPSSLSKEGEKWCWVDSAKEGQRAWSEEDWEALQGGRETSQA